MEEREGLAMRKEKIRLLHVIGGGEIGGAEQHVLTLLTALPQDRFQPSLACLVSGPFAELSRAHGIPTCVFPMRHQLDLSPLAELVRFSRQAKIDLIHTHGLRANILGRLTAKRLGIPAVTTVHSSLRYDYVSPVKAQIALALERATRRLSTGFIAVSQAIAQEIAGQGARNVRVVYNGYPPLVWENPQRLRRQYRDQWGVAPESLVIGCIARLHPTKGHTFLIDALKKIRPFHPDIHLVLIGEGPLRCEIEAALRDSSLDYTITGFLPEAYKALPAFDLFVLPSVSEGMGIVLLEALQAGVPIVATTAGGIPELLRSGIDGLLVPPADADALAAALTTLIENPDRRRQLVASGKTRWPHFSQERMAMQTADFYEQILATTKGNA